MYTCYVKTQLSLTYMYMYVYHTCTYMHTSRGQRQSAVEPPYEDLMVSRESVLIEMTK